MSDEQTVTGVGPRSRRALLAGAGAVGASVVLAACGTDTTPDASGSTTAPPAGGATGGAAPGGGAALAATSDVPEGGGLIVQGQNVVLTQPAAGQYKCFDAICTHQGCPVSNVDGGTINCTCHGSKFSIEDGSVTTGPARTPLAEKQITVEGDSISLA
ncbi:Rieske (2Fe-2S) protein [Solwaraspora sp. WMMD1047]|uniref:Rieske (2Fe-2S) protein n=1 Tax=Solwaraspora sp. WMMD1047 TaxID=3016102 RepID=UPI002417CD99|nr:Rieske (2Fe-2S) protein [Solwaraspora sp. WMMD1047]MDG4831934.1 Rieske (2Fe-2S) protein [Solwaraspora sp. WMMD1047]